MRVKTCPAKIKATGDDTGGKSSLNEGEFEAIVSAFGNVDAVGDVVIPGAFQKSLEKWGESGDPIPVIWSHDHNNPDAHIGQVLESKEVDEGLWVKGLVDLDEPFAQKVYKLMKGRRVTKFSFAYDMKDYEENDEGGWNLKELEIWEVGPTLIPANDQAHLMDIKARMERAGVNVEEFGEFLASMKGIDFKGMAADLSRLRNSGSKAGRVLSAKNESVLREIHEGISGHMEALKAVLSAVESSDDEEKEIPAEPATEGQPTDGKADEADDLESAKSAGPIPRSDSSALRQKLAADLLLAEID